MATTPLTGIISAPVRAKLYTVYALLGLGIGSTQVGYAAADAGQPTWLTVTLAVFAFVGTGLGFTAASNTNNPPQVQAAAEPVPPGQ
jgi:hypothetical protein